MGRRREGTDLRSHLRGERAATEWESRRESDKDTWSQESQSRRLMFGKGGQRPTARINKLALVRFGTLGRRSENVCESGSCV